MNAKATIERVLELAGPVMQPEKYRRYLSGLSPAHLNAKLKDLEESQTRTGAGYRPYKTHETHPFDTAATQRQSLPQKGVERTLAPARSAFASPA
jgi:hypothetical protein